MHNQEGGLKKISKTDFALISADCLKGTTNFSISGYLRPIVLSSQDSDWIKIFAELEVEPMDSCMPLSVLPLSYINIYLFSYLVIYLNTGPAWN